MNENKSKLPVFLIFGILIFWILGQVIIGIIFENWQDRASFGDSFGGVNSLFSGLAFGGLIYTIHLQMKELGLQRAELKETRQELSRSANAQEKSELALKSQIETMNVTAEINALNTIIQHYGMIMQKYTNGGETYWKAHQEQKPHLERLNMLLNRMSEYDKK